MAKYRQIHLSYWQDPFVETLTPLQKYFYLYLMTNSKTKQCGCYEISLKLIEYETGLTGDIIFDFIKLLCDKRKIAFEGRTGEYLIINWLKHNSYRSPKVRACIDNEVADIKCKRFADYINSVLDGNNPLDSLSIVYPETMHTGMQEEQKEEQKENNNTSSQIAEVQELEDDLPTLPPIEEIMGYKVAEHLWFRIKENNPNAKKPDLRKWSNSARLMMTRDKRPEQEIITVIDWCQDDEFWSGNILSVDKLRKQYDQLTVKMKKHTKKSNGPKYQSMDDLPDWLQAEIREEQRINEQNRAN